jgi:hypothetical protein
MSHFLIVMLNVVMLSVIMLSVVMLSVVMLSVVIVDILHTNMRLSSDVSQRTKHYSLLLHNASDEEKNV